MEINAWDRCSLRKDPSIALVKESKQMSSQFPLEIFMLVSDLFRMPRYLLTRWESRSPMDGHFSEKFNMNNCIQSFFLTNLEIFKYLCTDKCRKTPCMLIRPSYGDKVRPYENFGLPLFKSCIKAFRVSLQNNPQ